jgi:hypothetical protein
MWFVTSQKYGASALGLKRVLGLGSYETAWSWMHKLRKVMAPWPRPPQRDRRSRRDLCRRRRTRCRGPRDGEEGHRGDRDRGQGSERVRPRPNAAARGRLRRQSHALCLPGRRARFDRSQRPLEGLQRHREPRLRTEKYVISGSGEPLSYRAIVARPDKPAPVPNRDHKR